VSTDNAPANPSMQISDLIVGMIQYISPFMMFVLLFAPDVNYTVPITMVAILFFRGAFKDSQPIDDSRYWFAGFVIYCLAMAVNVNQDVSNSLFLLTICFVLTMLSQSIEVQATTLYSNVMISLTISHELLFCLFTQFSLASVLIFIVLAILIDQIILENDAHSMAVLFGCFIGVHATGWTLSGGFLATSTIETDELLQNWIKFISAPILGVLVFYGAKILIESINQVPDKALEES
tara:strand:- start:1289 stop:1996 length:708 start_codon:yes stop_codon:yes gene_type:complete